MSYRNLDKRYNRSGLKPARLSVPVLAATLIILGVVVISQLVLSCSSSDEGGQLTRMLPSGSELSGFTPAGEAVNYDRNTIWDHIGPNSDFYLYNGFQQLAAREYQADGGADTLVAEVFEFSSGREAFAVFSVLREPGFEQLDIGAIGMLKGDTLVSMKGKYLLRTYSSHGDAGEGQQQAAKSIAAGIKSEESLPEELSLFPREGLIENSLRLTAREFLGQTALSDVFSASYIVDSDTVVLSFRLGSDNQVASVVKEYIGSNGIITGLSFEGGNQVLSGEDTDLGKLYSTVKHDALCFVSGFSKMDTARELADAFYENLNSNRVDEEV